MQHDGTNGSGPRAAAQKPPRPAWLPSSSQPEHTSGSGWSNLLGNARPGVPPWPSMPLPPGLQSGTGHPNSPKPAAAAVASSILGWAPTSASPPAWVSGVDSSRNHSRSHSQRHAIGLQPCSLRPSANGRGSQQPGSGNQRSHPELVSGQHRQQQHLLQEQQRSERLKKRLPQQPLRDGQAPQQHTQSQQLNRYSNGRPAAHEAAQESAQKSWQAQELWADHQGSAAANGHGRAGPMLPPLQGRARGISLHTPAGVPVNTVPPTEGRSGEGGPSMSGSMGARSGGSSRPIRPHALLFPNSPSNGSLGAGGAKRSTEDMSAAVSREFGHSLADRHREGSATSDEVDHPRIIPRKGAGPMLRTGAGPEIDEYLMRLLRVGAANDDEARMYTQEKRTALESQPPHIAHAGTSHTSDDSSGVGPDRPTPEVLHPRAHTGTDAAAAAAADAEEEEALRAEEATAVAAVDKAAAAAEVQAAQAVVVAAAATWREDADEPQVVMLPAAARASIWRRGGEGASDQAASMLNQGNSQGDSQHAKVSSECGDSANVDTGGQVGQSAEARTRGLASNTISQDTNHQAHPADSSGSDRPTISEWRGELRQISSSGIAPGSAGRSAAAAWAAHQLRHAGMSGGKQAAKRGNGQTSRRDIAPGIPPALPAGGLIRGPDSEAMPPPAARTTPPAPNPTGAASAAPHGAPAAPSHEAASAAPPLQSKAVQPTTRPLPLLSPKPPAGCDAVATPMPGSACDPAATSVPGLVPFRPCATATTAAERDTRPHPVGMAGAGAGEGGALPPDAGPEAEEARAVLGSPQWWAVRRTLRSQAAQFKQQLHHLHRVAKLQQVLSGAAAVAPFPLQPQKQTALQHDPCTARAAAGPTPRLVPGTAMQSASGTPMQLLPWFAAGQMQLQLPGMPGVAVPGMPFPIPSGAQVSPPAMFSDGGYGGDSIPAVSPFDPMVAWYAQQHAAQAQAQAGQPQLMSYPSGVSQPLAPGAPDAPGLARTQLPHLVTASPAFGMPTWQQPSMAGVQSSQPCCTAAPLSAPLGGLPHAAVWPGVSPYASMPPLAFVAAHPGLAAPTSAVAAPVAHASDLVWFQHLQQPAPQALTHPATPAPAWGLGSLPPGQLPVLACGVPPAGGLLWQQQQPLAQQHLPFQQPLVAQCIPQQPLPLQQPLAAQRVVPRQQHLPFQQVLAAQSVVPPQQQVPQAQPACLQPQQPVCAASQVVPCMTHPAAATVQQQGLLQKRALQPGGGEPTDQGPADQPAKRQKL